MCSFGHSLNLSASLSPVASEQRALCHRFVVQITRESDVKDRAQHPAHMGSAQNVDYSKDDDVHHLKRPGSALLLPELIVPSIAIWACSHVLSVLFSF